MKWHLVFTFILTANDTAERHILAHIFQMLTIFGDPLKLSLIITLKLAPKFWLLAESNMISKVLIVKLFVALDAFEFKIH